MNSAVNQVDRRSPDRDKKINIFLYDTIKKDVRPNNDVGLLISIIHAYAHKHKDKKFATGEVTILALRSKLEEIHQTKNPFGEAPMLEMLLKRYLNQSEEDVLDIKKED
jgi:hypothetical protein